MRLFTSAILRIPVVQIDGPGFMDFARGGGYIENAPKSRAESVLNHPRFPSVKKEFRLMRALAGLPVDRTPVWFMRQAGRFMPKYRALRARYSMLEVCESAELSARVTFLPLEAYPDLDAAIIFSDLLLLFKGMGPGVAFLPDEGPKVLRPIRRASDVARLKLPDPRRDLRPVLDAIRIVKSEVAGRVPLLGFGGAGKAEKTSGQFNASGVAGPSGRSRTAGGISLSSTQRHASP